MDIATIGIAVDSSQAVQATQRLDQLGDQAVVTGRQVSTAGATATRGFSTMAGGARGLQQALSGHNTRMFAMQLSQVAQQTAATGQPLQALAIQAADIGMIFGTVGIAVGVAATALIPLAANLFGAGDGAATLEDELDRLGAVARALEAPMKVLEMSAAELSEKYGEAANRVRTFAEELARIRAAEAEDALSEQVRLLKDAAAVYFTVQDAGRNYRNSLLRIQEDFGLTAAAAREFEKIIQRVATAPTFEQQQATLVGMLTFLERMGVEVEGLPPEFRAALGAMIEISNRADETAAQVGNVRDMAAGTADAVASIDFGDAITGAEILAAQLGVSLATARAIAGQMAENETGAAGPGGGGGAITTSESARFAPAVSPILTRAQVDARDARATRGGGRRSAGGGGGSAAQSEGQRRAVQIMQEVERATIAAMSATDRYKMEVAELNGLMAEGYLSSEDYARAVGMLDAELSETQFAAVEAGIASIADSMADAILNAEDMGEAFRAVLAQMAADLVSSGIRELLTATMAGAGGGTGGQLMSMLFGGFRADGGPVQLGKAYVVGERGPELFVPGASGGIVPNGAGGMTVNIYNYASAEVTATEGPGGRLDIRIDEAVAGALAGGSKTRKAMRAMGLR